LIEILWADLYGIFVQNISSKRKLPHKKSKKRREAKHCAITGLEDISDYLQQVEADLQWNVKLVMSESRNEQSEVKR
jgi:hypothetical protein